MGSVYQRGGVWWLKYRVNDRIIRESRGSAKEGDAKTLLKLREGAATEGRPVIPRVEKVTVGELLDGMLARYVMPLRRALREAMLHVSRSRRRRLLEQPGFTPDFKRALEEMVDELPPTAIEVILAEWTLPPVPPPAPLEPAPDQG